ncbi:glycosyltransferase family 4 protein [Mycobacterium sp. SMC-4]|uniref:glycosyltransferase family 4 protein n=1 Tax=Mycobacterium sp. SMC-4 TaxID=2857059 RepID=UPI003D078DD1
MRHSTLRIGVLAPRFAPFRGGLETYVAAAAAALSAQGIDLTIITQVPRSTALPRREACAGYTVERHLLPVGEVFDVPSPAAVRAATRPGRFDVLWVHSYHTPLAWLAAEKATVPVVFTPHYHGVGHTPVRRILHRAYRPLGRRLMAASSRIIVDTDAEAELVLRDFPREVQPDDVVVVPPVINVQQREQLCTTGNAGLVLTVARQETYKRGDLLVRAAAALKERGASVQLAVVGDGPALAGHRELAAQLGVESTVTFTGAVDDETLDRFWASAAVYATASLQEAYGIGLAEALLTGLPVIASDIPAHREVVRRAGADAAAQLCDVRGTDGEVAARFADAITKSLAASGSREERAGRCALPKAAEVARQLDATLVAASRNKVRT